MVAPGWLLRHADDVRRTVVLNSVASDIALLTARRRGQKSVDKLLVVGLVLLHLLSSALCFLLAGEVAGDLALDTLQ